TLGEAATLLATLLGQDLDEEADGTFRIACRVAPARVISTVDTDARHGHKTSARSFDGYKGHVAIDPDSEIVTATAVTPGNSGDAAAAPELLADDLGTDTGHDAPLTVYADAAYGSGQLLETLETDGAILRIKVQPPVAPAGRFTKDDFTIDTGAGTVTCPAGRTATLRPIRTGRQASFGRACAGCPLMSRCTSARAGRSIRTGHHEAQLARARLARRDPAWWADYRATRPRVERRIAHLMRRHHGGRRARVRGRPKVAADFALLAGAVNLARLAVLGLVRQGGTWMVRAT
ncbi:MAG: transposase, partial [Chloroflexi bacterium]|nr:transposase [Chloroflexota bacterium]